MKYKIEITFFVLLLAITFFVGKSIQAQEFSPIAKLAQDYILRLNEELKETNNLVPTTRQKSVVVNPDAIAKEALTESIDTISKSIEEVIVEKERVITEIKEQVKQDIDASIIEIRKENTQTSAYELQKSVDAERVILFENITKTIEQIQPAQDDTRIQTIQELQIEIDASLEKIKANLEEESGLLVIFEKSKREVRETLFKFQQKLEEKKLIIESRQGDLVFQDSDSDGISDYDEIYIYKTDPSNARTREGDKTDGEKIREGINPLSDAGDKIVFQDPREDKESFVSSSYRLDKVQFLKEENKIIFDGTAFPNSYITLFIYTNPIIAKVKTDEYGKWKYELKEELKEGEHQIYVTTLESSGKIIIRSKPILFTKSSESVSIGIASSVDNLKRTPNFLKDNLILIILVTLIVSVILKMMLIGNHKTVVSAIIKLKSHVDTK